MEGKSYLLEHQTVGHKRRSEKQDMELRVTDAAFQGYQKLSLHIRLRGSLGMLRR
jgi:hypothetical protein